MKNNKYGRKKKNLISLGLLFLEMIILSIFLIKHNNCIIFFF